MSFSRRSMPVLRMDATCFESIVPLYVNIWSTLSTSSNTCRRSTWWTAYWRTSLSYRYPTDSNQGQTVAQSVYWCWGPLCCYSIPFSVMLSNIKQNKTNKTMCGFWGVSSPIQIDDKCHEISDIISDSMLEKITSEVTCNIPEFCFLPSCPHDFLDLQGKRASSLFVFMLS